MGLITPEDCITVGVSHGSPVSCEALGALSRIQGYTITPFLPYPSGRRDIIAFLARSATGLPVSLQQLSRELYKILKRPSWLSVSGDYHTMGGQI